MAGKGTVGVTFKLIDKASKTFENIALKGRKTQEEIERIGKVSQTANNRMKDFATGTKNAMDKLSSLTVKTTGVMVGLGAGILKCSEVAAEMQATTSQFQQVFGDTSKRAEAGLDRIASKTGIVSNRLKGYYTQLAAFAKSTGLTDTQALDVAERATLAAADLAAFWDKDISEMTERVQAYLKGNFENDAALGFSSTEATRNAMANRLYGKNYINLTEQEKQLALLAQIEEANKKTGALGQAQREADSYLNQLGNMKQSWIDIQAQIGEAFLPVVVESFKEISQYLQDNKDEIKQVAQTVADKITPKIKWVIENLDKVAQIGKVAAGLWIGGKVFGILTPIIQGASVLVPKLMSVHKWLKEITIMNNTIRGLGPGTAKLTGAGNAGRAGLSLAGAGTAGGLAMGAAAPLAMFGAGFGGVKALGKLYGWDVDYSNKKDMGYNDYAGAMSRGQRRQLATKKDKVSDGNTAVYITVQGNMIGNKKYMEETGSYIMNKVKTAMANAK